MFERMSGIDGWLSIESRLEEGTTISDGIARERTGPEDSAVPGTNGAAASVLIVDDSSTFRTAFRSYLLDQGTCEVAEAPSGEAAVKICRELRPSIVFMDVRMPGIGGLEACRQIRAESAATRLVLLSASLREAPEDLTSTGAARIMTKDELLIPGRIRTLVQQLTG